MRTFSLPKRPDVELTLLGLGGAQAGNLAQPASDAEIAASVQTAWELGIRYVDTAPHYGLGLSERRIGQLLAARPRDEFVISTKVGRLLVPSPQTASRSDLDVGGFAVPAEFRREWDLTRDGIRRSIEDSLTRLGLDRIDIAYLHDPDEQMDAAITEAIPALTELRDEGVLRAVGAGMNVSEHLARIVRESDVDVVLCAGRYSLLEQPALQDLLPAALDNRVGVVAAGIYNSGLLALPRPDQHSTYNYAPASPELIARANAIADICARHAVTLPDAAVAFVSGHPAVVSAVVGMRTADDAIEAVDRAHTPIPAALWADLKEERLLAPDAPTP